MLSFRACVHAFLQRRNVETIGTAAAPGRCASAAAARLRACRRQPSAYAARRTARRPQCCHHHHRDALSACVRSARPRRAPCCSHCACVGLPLPAPPPFSWRLWRRSSATKLAAARGGTSDRSSSQAPQLHCPRPGACCRKFAAGAARRCAPRVAQPQCLHCARRTPRRAAPRCAAGVRPSREPMQCVMEVRSK